MEHYVVDLDINSMYAWSPLVIKQSEIVKLLKRHRYGSHKAKIQLKRRLKLYKGAWVEYDTIEKKDWSKKHISCIEMSTNFTIDQEISFDFEAFKKENKECLNEIYGSLT